MALSKKHYEAIAEIIARQAVIDEDGDGTQRMEVADIVTDLADYFERDNERFNRSRFTHACYGEKK